MLKSDERSLKKNSFIFQRRFWLVSLLSSLSVIDLTLVWRNENISHFGITLLFGLAIFTLLQEKARHLKLGSSSALRLLGCCLVALALGLSFTDPNLHLLRLMPFISGLGAALLASGLKLKQYAQELTALFFLGVPSVLASFWLDISSATAECSRLLLLYLGFDVSGQGTVVQLPKGSIKVIYDCSGIDLINYLLSLAVLCLILFPLKRRFNNIIAPLFGIVTGFVANIFRVSMMAVFASNDAKDFVLWHTGEGSYVFAFIAVLALGLFYRYLLSREKKVLRESN